MNNNEELQKNVQDALKWEPLLKAAEIGVTAKDGIITLSGVVDSYAKKLEAEDAAKNVKGVKAVVEKIDILLASDGTKTDNEIAREVLNAFNWNQEIPTDKVQVKVEDGWVTLEGELKWNYQRELAKTAIANLVGVKGVSNSITIKKNEHDVLSKRI